MRATRPTPEIRRDVRVYVIGPGVEDIKVKQKREQGKEEDAEEEPEEELFG